MEQAGRRERVKSWLGWKRSPVAVVPTTHQKSTPPLQAFSSPQRTDVEHRKTLVWVTALGKQKLVRRSLHVFEVTHPIRAKALSVVFSKWFKYAVIVLILLNAITFAFHNPLADPKSSSEVALLAIGVTVSCLFLVEMLLKFVAFGAYKDKHSFLRNPWNACDCIIVVVSLFGFFPHLAPVRALQPLRLMLLIKGLRDLLHSFVKSLPLLLNAVALLFFLHILWGLAGLQLFKGAMRYRCYSATDGFEPGDRLCGYRTCPSGYACIETDSSPHYDITSFDHLPIAILTIFTAITTEGWTQTMYFLMDAIHPIVCLYWVSLVLFGSFFVVNLTLAAIKAKFSGMESQPSASMKKPKSFKARHAAVEPNGPSAFRSHRVIRKIHAVVQHKAFSRFFVAMVFLNIFALAVEHHGMSTDMQLFLDNLNTVFVFLFLIEMVLKLAGLGRRKYFEDSFNRFDFVLSWIGLAEFLLQGTSLNNVLKSARTVRTFRIVRVLRVVKLVSHVEALQRLVWIISTSFAQIGYVALLLALFAYCFAVVGYYTFAGKYRLPKGAPPEEQIIPRANFDTFVWSITAVFQILTVEAWNGVMFDGMHTTSHAAAMFFVAWIVIGVYFLMNMFLSIVLQNFEKDQQRQLQQRMDKKEKAKKKGDDIDEKERAGMRRALLSSFAQSKSQLFQDKKKTFLEGDFWIAVKHWTWRILSCRVPRRRNNKQTLFGLGRTSRAPSLPAQNLNEMLGEKNDRLCLEPRGERSSSDYDCDRTQERNIETKDREDSLVGDRRGSQVIEPAPGLGELEGSASRPRPLFRDDSQSNGSRCSDGKASNESESLKSDRKIGETPAPSKLEMNVTTVTSMNVNNEMKIEESIASPKLQRSVSTSSPRLSTEHTVHDSDVPQGVHSKSRSTGRQRQRDTRHDPTNCTDGDQATRKSSAVLKRSSDVPFKSTLGVPRMPQEHAENAGGKRSSKGSWNDTLKSTMKRLSAALTLSEPVADHSHVLQTPNFRISTADLKCSGGHPSDDGSRTSNGEGSELDTKRDAPKENAIGEKVAACLAPIVPHGGIPDMPTVATPGPTSSEISRSDAVPSTRTSGEMAFKRKASFKGNSESIFTNVHREKDKEDVFNAEMYDHILFRFEWFKRFALLIRSERFQNFVVVMIALSSIALAIDSPKLTDPTFRSALSTFDIIFVTFFSLETACKILVLGFAGHKHSYTADAWNNLDFVSVIAGCIYLALQQSSGSNVAIIGFFRILRVMRPLRLLSRSDGMRMVIASLLRAVPAMVNVLLVMILAWIVFGIVGVQLFSGRFYTCQGADVRGVVGYENDQVACEALGGSWVNAVQHFDHIGAATLTLFQVATLEGWLDVMHSGVDATEPYMLPVRDNNPASIAFFVVFIFVGSFFLISLFAGVVFDNFTQLRDQYTGMNLLTPRQKTWVHCQQIILNTKPVRLPIIPVNRHRQAFYHLAMDKRFEKFVILLIALNVLIISLQHYNQSEGFTDGLEVFNVIFSVFFLLECGIKLLAFGASYFRDMWNVFDFLIVLGSIIDIVFTLLGNSLGVGLGQVRVLRVFRVSRLVRLVRSAKRLRTLLNTLILSLPSLINVGTLLALMYCVFAILGVNLFALVEHRDDGSGCFNAHANFDYFPSAVLTLFRVSTGEDWNCLMAACRDESRGGFDFAWLYFFSFVMLVSFVTLNLFIAVILDNFSMVSREEDEAAAIDRERSKSQSALKKLPMKNGADGSDGNDEPSGFSSKSHDRNTESEPSNCSHSGSVRPRARRLTDEMVAQFVDAWQDLDPLATEYVPAEHILDLFSKIDRPLGLGVGASKVQILRFVQRITIPLHPSNRIHFAETLYALAEAYCGADLPESRLQVDIHRKLNVRLPSWGARAVVGIDVYIAVCQAQRKWKLKTMRRRLHILKDVCAAEAGRGRTQKEKFALVLKRIRATERMKKLGFDPAEHDVADHLSLSSSLSRGGHEEVAETSEDRVENLKRASASAFLGRQLSAVRAPPQAAMLGADAEAKPELLEDEPDNVSTEMSAEMPGLLSAEMLMLPRTPSSDKNHLPPLNLSPTMMLPPTGDMTMNKRGSALSLPSLAAVVKPRAPPMISGAQFLSVEGADSRKNHLGVKLGSLSVSKSRDRLSSEVLRVATRTVCHPSGRLQHHSMFAIQSALNSAQRMSTRSPSGAESHLSPNSSAETPVDANADEVEVPQASPRRRCRKHRYSIMATRNPFVTPFDMERGSSKGCLLTGEGLPSDDGQNAGRRDSNGRDGSRRSRQSSSTERRESSDDRDRSHRQSSTSMERHRSRSSPPKHIVVPVRAKRSHRKFSVMVTSTSDTPSSSSHRQWRRHSTGGDE